MKMEVFLEQDKVQGPLFWLLGLPYVCVSPCRIWKDCKGGLPAPFCYGSAAHLVLVILVTSGMFYIRL